MNRSLLRRLLAASLIVSIALAAAFGLSWSDAFWEWNHVIYDWQLRQGGTEPDPDIVIVAIDQASLAEYGRWPWPRRRHAELLDRLAAAGVRAVAFDVVLAEPSRDDPAGDDRLAAAIAANGRVVLPIIVEQHGVGGQLLETLPLPAFARAAAGLGHVDIDLDHDGIARSVYLEAGLGEPFWPHLAVVLLRVVRPRVRQTLPGLRNPDAAQGSPHTWVRDHQIWLPYAGPPGTFQRVSYVDVLRDDFPLASLRDKLVLVGITVPTVDDLPIPVSGEAQPMPGVEIVANVLNTLRHGSVILPVADGWRVVLAVGLVAVLLLVYTRVAPRWALLLTLMMLIAVLLTSLVLLHSAHRWLPPSAALVSGLLAYLLWSWYRLEATVRYLSQELARLEAEPAVLPAPEGVELADAMGFLRRLLPVSGVQIRDRSGRLLERWGEPIGSPPEAARDWTRCEQGLWKCFPAGRRGYWLGVAWSGESPPDAGQCALLDELARRFRRRPRHRLLTPLELVQTRIVQVQAATARLRAMRQFIMATLAQMADGVLVVDGLGLVLLGNTRAAELLLGDDHLDPAGRGLLQLLAGLEPTGAGNLSQALRQVLLDGATVQLEARTARGHELLLQMTPFTDVSRPGRGLIVNFADITPLKASERQRRETLDFLSHDLRSPVVSIISLTQIAEQRPLPTTTQELLERIRCAAYKTLELAEAFVQLARAESLDRGMLTEVDLVFVAENALEQIRPQAEARAMRLHSRIDIDAAWLRGDGALLERALINLLGNAVKYSPRGADITLGLTCSDGGVRCWVADTGSGIPAQDIPRLFERFQRLQSRAGQPRERGAGLGLAFVKAVVDKHGGRIEVVSEPGCGSRFTLFFSEAAETRDAA